MPDLYSPPMPISPQEANLGRALCAELARRTGKRVTVAYHSLRQEGDLMPPVYGVWLDNEQAVGEPYAIGPDSVSVVMFALNRAFTS